MANKKFETLDGFNSQGDVTIAGNVAVDTDVLFVDSTNNRVGIGKTNPATLLDVDGNITATNVNAEFHGDGSNITDVDAVTLDGVDSASFLRSDQSDTFTSGILSVSGNLSINGTSSELVLFQNVPLRFGNTSTPGVSFTFSRTPGENIGSLDIETQGTIDINIENDLNVNGAVSATSFVGDGSGLTNVSTGSTDYISGGSFSTGTGVLTLTGEGLAGASVDLDGRYVDLTTNQSVGGVKTFSSTITGSISGNAGTATKLASARTITIGDTSRTFDGSGNISWTVSQIGALADNGTAVNSSLLDSLDSTQFLRSDVADTKTSGSLTFNDSVSLRFGTSGGESTLASDASNTKLTLNSGSFLIANNSTTLHTFSRTTGSFTASGDVTAFSDERLKENIVQIDDALNIVKQLRGVYYTRKDQEDDDRHVGVIAQEIEQHLPEVVHTQDDEQQTKSVSYGNIVALLIEAIKEQQQEIEELKRKVQ